MPNRGADVLADLALDRSRSSLLTKPSNLRPAEPTICRWDICGSNRISSGQAERQSVKKMVETIAIKICRWAPIDYRPDQLPFRFAFLEDPLRRPVVDEILLRLGQAGAGCQVRPTEMTVHRRLRCPRHRLPTIKLR